ncbi:hypothetical protein CLI92_14380 [Vandammella animalimorsus]|uniref:RHS protein conserved region domain-containing protein n=1 Tax=Vandammella animalimorsus TaxID=2029117 RepID=A0A2A2T1S0_9BURK|nr:RHS repeat-associated core domain-containing protein [Vandammella animalimorsus]PAX15397.1 hypothetical protein CLI92_14380 [Vandammella animalimorsus]PAX16968.1 hypothetical protein CLI93_14365 [Vandammella animalimorsus]
MAEANEAGQITKAYGFNPNTHDAEEELWSTDPVWQADIHNGSLTSSQTRYHYITTDHLGTPILATDKSGNKTWRGYSEAFGNTGIEADNSTQINLRFPGQYWDKETGLHQNFFRDYSPARGRYIQSDPIGLVGDFNVFAYAKASPTVQFDPTGEIVPVLVARFIGGAFEEFAVQTGKNLLMGCSLTNLDLWDITVSGMFGMIGLPGWKEGIGGLLLKKKARPPGLSLHTKAAKRQRKIAADRVKKHNKTIDSMQKDLVYGMVAGFVLDKAIGDPIKDWNGDSRDCGC